MTIDSVLKSRLLVEEYQQITRKLVSEPRSEMCAWPLGLKFSVTKET